MKTLERLGIDIHKSRVEETAVYALASVYLLLEKKIGVYLRRFQLTTAKFNALMVIKHVGRDMGLSQIEIGRRLIVTASNMTRLLDKLARDGLIERVAQAGDRRVKLIKITSQGSKILDAAWPGYCKCIYEQTNRLGRHELQLTAKMLVSWLHALEGRKA
ncbi:MAG: MarR family transcriptional regulator [Candidatus Omnitrophica bacterium]|nr:MarR family transcriptional regulator [Candidatus Omnitrophota bacterium]